ncbi:uncharacterized protein [Medicago truncatula]|uniref:Transmembrane protein, putative n=1 Tax=Medicago truncatula TaxID=3880 RepID=G7JA97_MEDTR|nr:uncharacterized protein LOC11445276 isoform X1 [Medicago truncatula]AES72729.2 transmembrane protein, putative [Medicago truncatula]
MLDEFIRESYRIPWLIWIQLIVLFLLLALFYIFIFDDDDAATEVLPETSSASSKGFLFDEIQHIDSTKNYSIAPVSTNLQQRNITTQQQDGQNPSEIATCSNMRSGEVNEGESSTPSSHTCHFFQLATVAFLKCFGLDSTSDSSSNQKCRKRKES